MSRRRQQRRAEKARRHPPPPGPAEPWWAASTSAGVQPASVVVRQARAIERLAYTRSQAAAALGISRATFDRRVLPYVETIELGSGSRLIPIGELERFIAARRRGAGRKQRPSAPVSRPSAVPVEVVERIRELRASGCSLRQIAAELNATGPPPAHGGTRWWPSTVRAALIRSRSSWSKP